MWVTPGPNMEVAPTYLRRWDLVWVAVGGLADAPLPLGAWGRSDAAPLNLRTRRSSDLYWDFWGCGTQLVGYRRWRLN